MRFETRPLSLSEILDAAFRLIQTEWRTLVGLSLIAQAPLALFAFRMGWLFGSAPASDRWKEIGLVTQGMMLTWLVLYPFVVASLTSAVGSAYHGRHPGPAEAARAGLDSLLRLVLSYGVYVLALGAFFTLAGLGAAVLGASIVPALVSMGTGGTALAVVLVGALLVAAVLAFLFVGSVSALLAPVIVLESRGIFGSVRQAFAIGRTAKGRLIGTVMTAGLIVGIPVSAAQVMIGSMPALGVLVWALLQGVGLAFTTAVAVVLYLDLRSRSERPDLGVRAWQQGEADTGPGLGER